MAVHRHVRLASGRSFEIRASIHRYHKGRKTAHKHGLLLEAREAGAEGRAPLELLIDLSYLFAAPEAARLAKLRTDRARDRALEALLGADTSQGVTVAAPGVDAAVVQLISAEALEAEHTLIDHRGPCRICCVPGKNTVNLRVMDAHDKEVLVCSLPPEMLRLPGQQREPMWWSEVTLNPFDISWERLEAPSVLDAARAVLQSLTCQEALQQRAEEEGDWVDRCGQLVTRGLGRLAWSEPKTSGEAMERRVVRALAPSSDRFGLELDRPAYVTYHLNLPPPCAEGGMDQDRVVRRIRKAMVDLAASLFVKGGSRKDPDAGRHVRTHSTYIERHPSEMLPRILNLIYTETNGFHVTPGLAPRKVVESLYDLEEQAMAAAAKLWLNWNDQVRRCASDAILEAVSTYSGTYEAPEEGGRGIVAEIKNKVNGRLKDLANPRVKRSLPGGAMGLVLATSLRLEGLTMEQAVPLDTEVPGDALWYRSEQLMLGEGVDEAACKDRRVRLAAETVARELMAEISAARAEVTEVLEQEEPGNQDPEEWMDRRARAERKVQALRVLFLSRRAASMDDKAWERRCFWRWYLELAPGRRGEVQERLRRAYLSQVFMGELQRAFKEAVRSPDVAPMDTSKLRWEPHRFPEWFAGWLVEGQRRIGERLPSMEKIVKTLLPEDLFLNRPAGSIQLNHFLVRAMRRIPLPTLVFLTASARREPYCAAAAACGGMEVKRMIRAANSNKLETDGHWHDALLQYIHNEPNLYNRPVPVLYDERRTVEELCELVFRNTLEMGCLRRGHPYEVDRQAPHSAKLIKRLVALASSTEGSPLHEHYWRFKDLDMQSEQAVSEAVSAVPWSELRCLLGPELCRIMDTPRPDGSPRTFQDLTALEIFAIAHKLGRKNSWMEV